MRVVWSTPAARRLEELRDVLLATAGEEAAHRVVLAIVLRAESLRTLPLRGRRVPERPASDLRELIEQGRYRIVYRVRPDSVQVVTVFDGRGLLPEELAPEPEARPARRQR